MFTSVVFGSGSVGLSIQCHWCSQIQMLLSTPQMLVHEPNLEIWRWSHSNGVSFEAAFVTSVASVLENVWWGMPPDQFHCFISRLSMCEQEQVHGVDLEVPRAGHTKITVQTSSDYKTISPVLCGDSGVAKQFSDLGCLEGIKQKDCFLPHVNQWNTYALTPELISVPACVLGGGSWKKLSIWWIQIC